MLDDALFENGGYIEGSEIEIFVCRGMAANKSLLYTMLADDDCDLIDEMQKLREQATKEKD